MKNCFHGSGKPMILQRKSEVMKKSQESFVLLVLKHCELERYASLITADAPDLQTPDKSIGIEVTYAVSQDVAKINGECVKYTHGKDTPQDKAECERRIIQHGGSIDRIAVRDSDVIVVLSFPVTDSQEEMRVLENAVRNKMKKVSAYKQKGFDTVGLFLILDTSPASLVNIIRLLPCFHDAQRGYTEQYSFFIFVSGMRYSSMISRQRSTESLRLIKLSMMRWKNVPESRWSRCMVVVMER